MIFPKQLRLELAVLSIIMLIGCVPVSQSDSTIANSPESAATTTPESTAELNEPTVSDENNPEGTATTQTTAASSVSPFQAKVEQLTLNLNSYEDVVAVMGEPSRQLSQEPFDLNIWIRNNSALQVAFDNGDVWLIGTIMGSHPTFEAIQADMTADEIVTELGEPQEIENMIYTSYVWESESGDEMLHAAFINGGYSFSEDILRGMVYTDAQGEIVELGIPRPSWDLEP